jgi:hypothetical protein
MSAHRRYQGYITPPVIPTSPLTIPDDSITHDMLQNNSVWGNNVKNGTIPLSSLDSFAIEEIQSWISASPINIDSNQIIPGAIDSSHFSDDAKKSFVKPTFCDFEIAKETLTITQSQGKVFIPFGDIS